MGAHVALALPGGFCVPPLHWSCGGWEVSGCRRAVGAARARQGPFCRRRQRRGPGGCAVDCGGAGKNGRVRRQRRPYVKDTDGGAQRVLGEVRRQRAGAPHVTQQDPRRCARRVTVATAGGVECGALPCGGVRTGRGDGGQDPTPRWRVVSRRAAKAQSHERWRRRRVRSATMRTGRDGRGARRTDGGVQLHAGCRRQGRARACARRGTDVTAKALGGGNCGWGATVDVHPVGGRCLPD